MLADASRIEGELAIPTPEAAMATRAHGVLERGSGPPILPALAAHATADRATPDVFKFLGSATCATVVMVARGFTFLILGLQFTRLVMMSRGRDCGLLGTTSA